MHFIGIDAIWEDLSNLATYLLLVCGTVTLDMRLMVGHVLIGYGDPVLAIKYSFACVAAVWCISNVAQLVSF